MRSIVVALVRIALLAPAFLTPLFAPPLFAPFTTQHSAAAPAATGATIVDLGPQLEAFRAGGNVPALAAAVVTRDGVVAHGIAGVRKQGDPTPVELTDLWHIGSITKSFTSTLFALQVEAGKVRFEQTLAEVLPEAAGTPYADVTFEQLMSHRSGMPGNPTMELMVKSRTSKDPLTEQRRQMVAAMLATTPEHEKGTKFLYSNAGYVTTGAALERLLGMPWEDLVRAQVIEPLGLRSAGFGAPGHAGVVDQPWGHLYPPGSPRPPFGMQPGLLADNPPFLGPAGTLHLSIDDLAAWLREHMNGEAGSGTLLQKATFERLHRVIGDRYALGWVDDTAAWADGERLVWHNGSNSMWYAFIGFLPARGLGIAVATNGGIGNEPAVMKAVEALGKEWLAKAAAPESGATTR